MFRLNPRSIRAWGLTLAVALAVLVAGSAGLWTARHAVAIQRLTGTVGGTTFLDAQGRPWFPLDDQRVDVPLDRIATTVKDAVIAVEDHRFYLHVGVDPIGLGRAILHNVSSEGGSQGGSTLTQQLARTLFLSTAHTYGRKLKEAALALMIEALLSKRKILELYLNRVYLGGGVYGVEAMSQRLFGKAAADLTLGEAALIAGIIRAPATYSPWDHLDAALARRQIVLRRMREEGKIPADQERLAAVEAVRPRRPSHAAERRHGYAKAYLRQQFRAMYGDDNPADWTVLTSFEPALQDLAERAVGNGLRRLGEKGLQAALVALDPQTGDIRAMVGGADFAATPFNRAVLGRRQPGSAFKPFVYAAGLETGLSPVSVVRELDQVAIAGEDGVWTPRDERLRGRRTLTLREALLASSNAAAVALQQSIGSRPVLRLATDLGIGAQPDVPSLALGSGLVTPLELTAAYAAFPTLGDAVRPRSVLAVSDADGQVLRRGHVERRAVLAPAVAYQVTSMLRDVVERGTARGARSLGVVGDIAGKTGTTNDAVDAWFVGFSSSLVVGVWVGFDTPRPIRDGASGAAVALPIWAEFMRGASTTHPPTTMPRPEGVDVVRLCRLSHQRPLEQCPTYEEYFKDGDARPSALCPVHDGSFPMQIRRAAGSLVGALARRLGDLLQ